MIATASSLRAAALLLGRLLLREVDQGLLADLNKPEMKAGLLALGVHVPPVNQESLDDLAAEWFDYFVSPKHQVPLVQSLFEEGKYDGVAEVGTRQFAEAANLTLDEDLARGARSDQLGAQLLLWAQIDERDPKAAKVFAVRHLAWCGGALHERVGHSGFYGGVCLASSELVRLILSSEETPS